MNKIFFFSFLIMTSIFLNAVNDINLNFIVNPKFSYEEMKNDSIRDSLNLKIISSLKDTLNSQNYSFIIGDFFYSVPDSLNQDSILVKYADSLSFVNYIIPTDFYFKSKFYSKKLFASNMQDTTRFSYPKQVVSIKADSFRVDIISLYSPDFTITAELDSTISFDFSQKRRIKELLELIPQESNMIVVLTSYPKYVCKRIFPKDERIKYIINFDRKKYNDFVFRKNIHFKRFDFENGIGQIHLNFKNGELNNYWRIIKK